MTAPSLPASGTVSSRKWPLNNNFYASTDKPLAERIKLAHWGQSLLCQSQLCRCICTVDRTSEPEEMMLHPWGRRDVTALATYVNKCTEVNWTVNFNITGNRKMMKNGLHIFKFSDFLTSLHLIRRKNIFFCPTTINCGRPWRAAYINFNQNTHRIQVLTKPLCRAQAIFYSLPNNELGTKYCGLTYGGK